MLTKDYTASVWDLTKNLIFDDTGVCDCLLTCRDLGSILLSLETMDFDNLEHAIQYLESQSQTF